MTNALKSMENSKSPGNDGLTVEFYKFFWIDLKHLLFNSFLESEITKCLSASQKQAVIKLLTKKDKDKRFIENWRPISLLNIDTKILSKVLANRLKPTLPSIIAHDQTAYVHNRFIGESVRLVSDIIEMTDILNIEGYLVTADIQKAFDSLDHNFLLATLSKSNFGKNFINWIKIILNGQESCVFNGGFSTGYFPLQRGCRQGDPISAYLFILAFEVLLEMIRANKEIRGISILEYVFKLSAYADDATFFVSDILSIKELFATFNLFSSHSGLRLNTSKTEICGVGAKKGDSVDLFGAKCLNLEIESVKILGIHFSYNRELMNDKNYLSIIKKIESTLIPWNKRLLTLEGRILVFKTLAFSKIVYISYLTDLPSGIIDQLQSIQANYIWQGKKSKIKHITLIGDYSEGGLKNIDIKANK